MQRFWMWLTVLAIAGLTSTAAAAPPTGPQSLAIRALELEFDRHSVTATAEELDDAFSAACKAGYSLGCQRNAWVVYGKADLPTAAKLFEPACEEGDPVACLVVGWNLDVQAPITSERDRLWRAAALQFRRLCDDDFHPACFDYGASLYFNKGFKADPRAGIVRWQDACETGEVHSCRILGELTMDGSTVVRKDARKAGELLQQACDGGALQACYSLGKVKHADWMWSEHDEWYRNLCVGGHRSACSDLAQLYLNGTQKAKDESVIDSLLTRGCDLGSAGACFEAGRRAQNSDKPDYVEASNRFNSACELGDLSGCTSQVQLITDGMVEGSVKTAPQAFETACLKRNSSAACTALALELLRGVDLARDPVRARALLHRACVDADSAPNACSALGGVYSDGTGGDRDRTEAVKYLRWACDQGQIQACLERGDLLNLGRGVQRDDYDALAMYQKACDGGMGEGCYKAGTILFEGTYVDQNLEQAQALFGRACSAGSGDGCTGLGRSLEAGQADEQSLIRVRDAYARGNTLGSLSAKREFARALWNGLGGSKKRSQARKLASEACQAGDAVACQGAEAL